MSDARLHQNAPRPQWPHRGRILARNTAIGFIAGSALWILALLTASSFAALAPGLGPAAAAGAWQAAWRPSGFLYTGTLVAGVMALLTVTIWAIDRDEATS